MDGHSKYAIAFPARDAFYQGLSADFYNEFEAFRKIYDTAGSFIGEDLHDISYKNPSQRPELHTVCLITHCFALYTVLAAVISLPKAYIGFSQGEFTAVASGAVVAFPEVLGLVYELEKLLSESDTVRNGGMARVFELDREKLYRCCKEIDPEGKEIAVAICLSKDQNVIAGKKEKLARVSKLAKESGARWIIPIESGGAFHSPLCCKITEKSDLIFDKYHFYDAQRPVFACSDGSCSTKGREIKSRLSRQISSPIHWDRVIANLKAGDTRKIIELGPGCTISGNTRIIDPEMDCHWVNDGKDMEKLLRVL